MLLYFHTSRSNLLRKGKEPQKTAWQFTVCTLLQSEVSWRLQTLLQVRTKQLPSGPWLPERVGTLTKERKHSCLVTRWKAWGQEGSRSVNLKFPKERGTDCFLSYNFQLCEGTSSTDHHYAAIVFRALIFWDEVQGISKRWIFISSLGKGSILPKPDCLGHIKE